MKRNKETRKSRINPSGDKLTHVVIQALCSCSKELVAKRTEYEDMRGQVGELAFKHEMFIQQINAQTTHITNLHNRINKLENFMKKTIKPKKGRTP
jgi:predicted  nucleic acid-binding Zn-ribbon protein